MLRHWMQVGPERVHLGRGGSVHLRLPLKELAVGGHVLTTPPVAGQQV